MGQANNCTRVQRKHRLEDAELSVRKRKTHSNQNRLPMCSQFPRSRLRRSAQHTVANPWQPHREMVKRADVRLLVARGLGLALLGMSALLKPVNPVRILPRRSRDKTLRNDSAFETSVMLLRPIANSSVPARDIPFFAHVVTPALGSFPARLLVWLHTIGNATGINRQVDCFKELCVCKPGLSSRGDRKT